METSLLPQTQKPKSSGQKPKLRLLLPPWTSFSPRVPVVPNQHLHFLPPIVGDNCSGALQFDFTPFLLADCLVMDRDTWERVKSERHRRPFHLLFETMEVLYSEGRLELQNYADAIKRAQADIEDRTDLNLKAANLWIKPVCQAIDQWCSRSREMSNVFGSSFGQEDKIPHGPKFVLFTQNGKLNGRSAQLLRAKLKQFERDPAREPDADIRQMILAYLSYINTNISLGDHFNCPVYDWPNFDGFYRMKFQFAGVPEPLNLRQRGLVKRLFQFTVPDCRPNNIRDFLRMLNDKNLNHFRQKISEWSDQESEAKTPVELQAEMTTAMKALSQVHYLPRRKIMMWGINASKVVGVLPGMHKLMLAVEGGLELKLKMAEQEALKPHKWYFFTQTLLHK